MTEPELVAWGEHLGGVLRPPILVTLAGELGTGKTTLVRAICRGLGVAEDVTSPTFALVHEYASPHGPIYHLDLYRLETPDELTAIGWDEVVSSHAVVLVEWPERAGDRLPREHISIRLEHIAPDPERRLLYAGGDSLYESQRRGDPGYEGGGAR